MRSTSFARPARRLAALGVAALTAASLTACASDAAGEAAPSAGSGQVATSVTQANFAEAITAGQESLTSMRMEMEFSGSAAAMMGGMSMVADVDLTADTPTLSTSMTIEGMDVEMIYIDGSAYISLGALTGGQFLAFSAEDLAGHPEFADLADQFETDLGAQAAALAPAITAFEEAGTDTIYGTDVTLFILTLDSARLGEAAGIPAGTPAGGEMTVTYALDANNVPRRIDLTMEVDGQQLTITTRITNINAPVTITAPEPDQILSADQLGL